MNVRPRSTTAEIVNITLAGDGAALEYTPKFTYMGFRYVQLTGYPGVPTFETLTAHFLNTMYDLIGDISFSDPNLNAVQVRDLNKKNSRDYEPYLGMDYITFRANPSHQLCISNTI